jgi:hypothetical protein
MMRRKFIMSSWTHPAKSASVGVHNVFMQDIKQEAEYLTSQLRKEAAGRVCQMSRDEWVAAYEHIAAYYREKKLFNDLINAPLPKLKGPKASDRLPFL